MYNSHARIIEKKTEIEFFFVNPVSNNLIWSGWNLCYFVVSEALIC